MNLCCTISVFASSTVNQTVNQTKTTKNLTPHLCDSLGPKAQFKSTGTTFSAWILDKFLGTDNQRLEKSHPLSAPDLRPGANV